jgi:hypothetical protein
MPVVTISESGVEVLTVEPATAAAGASTVQKRYKGYVKQFPAVREVLSAAKATKILVLHDCAADGYAAGLVAALMSEFRATVVFAASGNPANFRAFVKRDNITTTYLPMLSLTEVLEFTAASAPAASVAAIRERCTKWFGEVGGVLRHLRNESSVAAAVDAQVLALPRIEFSPGQLRIAAAASENDPSAVIGLIPNADRSSIAGYDFVSEGAADLWLRRFVLDGAQEKTLAVLKHAPNSRSIAGYSFERYVITELMKGDTSCLFRYAATTSEAQHATLARWALPPLTPMFFAGTNYHAIHRGSKDDANRLYLPLVTNFPLIDCAVVSGAEVTAVQITIAERHQPTQSQVTQFFQAMLEKKLTVKAFVWVVDEACTLDAVPRIQGDTAKTDDPYYGVPHYICRLSELGCWIKNPVTSAVVRIPQSDFNEADLPMVISKWTGLTGVSARGRSRPLQTTQRAPLALACAPAPGGKKTRGKP